MKESLERAKALLLEDDKLTKKTSNVEDFGNAYLEDFVEAKGNYDFINENLFFRQ